MNALPGRYLVDLDATDRDRAASVWALSHMVASRYHPRNDEAAWNLGMQLAFTAWHCSDRATQRGGEIEGPCGLFGLGFGVVSRSLRGLRHSHEQHGVLRFLDLTGMDHEVLRQVPTEVLLTLAVADDLLAASLAAEAYRSGGPLPGTTEPRRCAETWVSRLLTVRGPRRRQQQASWIRGFAHQAEELLELLD